jgi:hypothetical protein
MTDPGNPLFTRGEITSFSFPRLVASRAGRVYLPEGPDQKGRIVAVNSVTGLYPGRASSWADPSGVEAESVAVASESKS